MYRLAKKLEKFKIQLILFLIVFCVYNANLFQDFTTDYNKTDYRRLATSSDVISNTYLPYVLIKYHTFKLNDIIQYIRIFDSNIKVPYYIIKIDKDYYSSYPALTGIMALPVYVIPVLLNKIPDLKYYENVLKVLALGRLTASLYTALTAVIMYQILKRFNPNKSYGYAFIFTLFFALGTNSWSISSRGLWQHTISMFFIALALLTSLIAVSNQTDDKKKFFFLVSFFSGLAIATRPTNLIFIIPTLIYFSFIYKKYIKYLIVGLLPGLLFMAMYNFLIFGSPISEGYGARNDFNWSTPLSASLPAYGISPARSFLFISPPLILGFIYFLYLIFRFFKKHTGQQEKTFICFGIGFILSMILFGKWYAWDGANGFGYRMLTDFLPVLTLFSFLCFTKFGIKMKMVVLIFCVYSVIIQWNAVFNLKSRCNSENNWNFRCVTPKFN